jgi:hypothetical protein
MTTGGVTETERCHTAVAPRSAPGAGRSGRTLSQCRMAGRSSPATLATRTSQRRSSKGSSLEGTGSTTCRRHDRSAPVAALPFGAGGSTVPMCSWGARLSQTRTALPSRFIHAVALPKSRTPTSRSSCTSSKASLACRDHGGNRPNPRCSGWPHKSRFDALVRPTEPTRPQPRTAGVLSVQRIKYYLIVIVICDSLDLSRR